MPLVSQYLSHLIRQTNASVNHNTSTPYILIHIRKGSSNAFLSTSAHVAVRFSMTSRVAHFYHHKPFTQYSARPGAPFPTTAVDVATITHENLTRPTHRLVGPGVATGQGVLPSDHRRLAQRRSVVTGQPTDGQHSDQSLVFMATSGEHQASRRRLKLWRDARSIAVRSHGV